MGIENYYGVYILGGIIFLLFLLCAMFIEYPKRQIGDFGFGCLMSVLCVVLTLLWPLSLILAVVLVIVLSFLNAKKANGKSK